MITAITCPQCSAPVKPHASRCDYCGTGFMITSQAQSPDGYGIVTGSLSTAQIEAWVNPRPGAVTWVTTGTYDDDKRRAK